MPRTNRNIREPNSIGQVGQTQGTIPPRWRPSLIVAVPLPVVIASVVVFDIILPPTAQFSKGLAFEPPFLYAVLSTVFLAITSFMVGYVSFKSYMQNGWTFLVLMGSGALAWGSASLLSGWLSNLPSGPNAAITISNTGALVASIFHTASATWSKGPSLKKDPRVRRSVLFLAYGGVLAFTTIFAVVALEGMTPLFFVPGVGQTPLRMAVLISAIALFAASSTLFTRRYFLSGSKSSTLYWYFLALGLTGVGLAAVFFGRAPGDPISWTGRIAMFLGGTYFLKAVHTAFNGIGAR
ncbi:MAG TPA: MASE3 domain-containing protein [Candidatus Bathyarchaeia archaeon]|nr:MASE3 domain-containing protein [Candidatus Bathyarchaeia archaeon]